MERLRSRYRLVVMNDETFEERLSVRLTPLGFLILIAATTIIMTTLVVSLVAFTPLREYIPGYADVGLQTKLDSLSVRADSLQNSMVARKKYMDNLRIILTGQDSAEHPKNFRDSTKKYANIKAKPSKEDSALRDEIEDMDEYSLKMDVRHQGISGFFFFVPVKGTITNPFNMAEGHFGVDIVAADENEPIRATLDGTVISAGYTVDDGYVIQVQHSDNLVSIYKHCASLLKKTGDYVKAGDPIAIVGSSGEQIAEPNLHFELWYNGTPIDPQENMVF
ncbi:MAG TPA: M23 family metallopeptidase [Bacteroidia bacterium]|nr:M23 family metallopeptidase [Bacteroidia bacterium]